MSLRIPLAAALVLSSFAALAQAPTEGSGFKGDANRGRQLAYTCNGCHAIPNYKNVYPTYSVPKLHGQRPEYLVAALKAYKSGERSHATMHAQASSLSEQDMADIAAHLAGPNVLTESKSEAVAGRPAAAEVCVACHGSNGVGITADYPSLAGQHRDYIVRALTDYQKGGRKNPIMAGMAANLSAQDIEALATYYSTRSPSLSVVPKKGSVLSSK